MSFVVVEDKLFLISQTKTLILNLPDPDEQLK